MITNERQSRITKAALTKIEKAIAAHDNGQPPPDVHPTIYEAMGDALRSEAEVLRDQLQAYERLRAGRVKQRTFGSLRELPKACAADAAGRLRAWHDYHRKAPLPRCRSRPSVQKPSFRGATRSRKRSSPAA